MKNLIGRQFFSIESVANRMEAQNWHFMNFHGASIEIDIRKYRYGALFGSSSSLVNIAIMAINKASK